MRPQGCERIHTKKAGNINLSHSSNLFLTTRIFGFAFSLMFLLEGVMGAMRQDFARLVYVLTEFNEFIRWNQLLSGRKSNWMALA